MKTRLLLARHGNTFHRGETPLRVGARTDLPLVETKLGSALGLYLKLHDMIPCRIAAAPLQRTMQTAELAIKALELDLHPEPDPRLIEIDYGPDEGRPEDEVIARIGAAALERWNRDSVPPPDWKVDPKAIKDIWLEIGRYSDVQFAGKTQLLISSNGILRFAPHLTGNFEAFAANHRLKVSTGGLCVLEKEPEDTQWNITQWNLQPAKLIAANNHSTLDTDQ